jgi:hypothetical protein
MSAPPPSTDPPPEGRPATLREVVGAVFWSFFGVRKGKAMQARRDRDQPHQVIIVGIVLAALLVVLLLTLVA